MSKLKFKSGPLEPRWILPTPSYTLNRALGGGLESGRIHCLWGPKASNKSTLALHMVAEAQRRDKECIYVDAEKTYNDKYAQKCGVDIDKLRLLDEGANVAEDLLETLLPEMEKSQAQVVVIDSLSSVLQQSFFDKPEANPMGIYSRSAKFVLAKLLNALNREHQIILISHATMDLSGYRPMLSAQMGTAQGHWTSNIIGFKAPNGQDHLRDDGYRRIKWKIEKSKQPVWPFEGEYFFNGMTASIDRTNELIDAAVDLDIVTGTTWLYFEELKFHGKKQLLEEVKNDLAILDRIEAKIKAYDNEFRTATVVDTMEQTDENI